MVVGSVIAGSVVMVIKVASGKHHRPLVVQLKLIMFASMQTSILVMKILKIFIISCAADRFAWIDGCAVMFPSLEHCAEIENLLKRSYCCETSQI